MNLYMVVHELNLFGAKLVLTEPRFWRTTVNYAFPILSRTSTHEKHDYHALGPYALKPQAQAPNPKPSKLHKPLGGAEMSVCPSGNSLCKP